jgi:hypothetical protein
VRAGPEDRTSLALDIEPSAFQTVVHLAHQFKDYREDGSICSDTRRLARWMVLGAGRAAPTCRRSRGPRA